MTEQRNTPYRTQNWG